MRGITPVLVAPPAYPGATPFASLNFHGRYAGHAAKRLAVPLFGDRDGGDGGQGRCEALTGAGQTAQQLGFRQVFAALGNKPVAFVNVRLQGLELRNCGQGHRFKGQAVRRSGPVRRLASLVDALEPHRPEPDPVGFEKLDECVFARVGQGFGRREAFEETPRHGRRP